MGLYIDIKTWFITLIFGNLVTVILIMSYPLKLVQDRGAKNTFVAAKWLQFASYFLLALRSAGPGFYPISILAGNLFYFAGLACESIAILIIIKAFDRRKMKGYAVFIVGALTLLYYYYFVHDLENVRIAVVSSVVGLLFWFSSYFLMKGQGRSQLQRTMGILYFLAGLGTMSRAFAAIAIDASMTLFTSNIYQVAYYVSVFIVMVLGSNGFVLLAKENTDTISEQLKALDKQKDEFLANTSHELKTPLHGILNMSQTLLEGAAGPLNRGQRESLSVVIAVARRMSNLINDILDFSKLKNSTISLHRRRVNLKTILGTNEEVFRSFIADKPIRLEIRLEDVADVSADEERLLQILYNLIGNAAKFTKEGVIAVSVMPLGDEVQIAVSDTGIGVPAHQHEAIFRSFEQVGAAVSREYGGTGLGLGIAKRLVELHGGSLTVSSTPGVGSTFAFTLAACGENESDQPLTRDKPIAMEAARLESMPIDDPSPAMSGVYTILAVDDDPVNLRVIVNSFAHEPYRVIVTRHGKEALEILARDRRIDLVILDVMMPELSGYDICREIRRQLSLIELPVLLVTAANNRPEEILAGFSAGANDFLSKPFYTHELRARVRTLLSMKKTAEESLRFELAYLQAQIKPHFLYNALNTISNVCRYDAERANDLLSELGFFLRSSFDFRHKDKLVSLDKELQVVNSYLCIEKARFEERLEVVYDIDKGADCRVPPLTLQPIVENAIRHGIMKRIEGGTVRISVRSEEKCCLISVEDNGVGFNPRILEALLEGSGQEFEGVGLRNIQMRMLRMFGYGLEIESDEASGTKIVMRIPQGEANR